MSLSTPEGRVAVHERGVAEVRVLLEEGAQGLGRDRRVGVRGRERGLPAVEEQNGGSYAR